MGASFSLTVGQLGMRMAVQANIRVASASRWGFNEALSIAYYAGTITGMLTDGLGLLGGTLFLLCLGKLHRMPCLVLVLVVRCLRCLCVWEGAFTPRRRRRRGTGGKVEKDIPEDDPRNAAVIAIWSGIMWATAPVWRRIFSSL